MQLVDVDTDADILAALPPDALLGVDTPLEVPNETGNRDLERVIAWCDVPLFPVAGMRLDKVAGGRRGVDLAESLRAVAGRVVEVSPELVLRQLVFEQGRHGRLTPLDLADYRREWLETRAPVYRPKGAGRAKPGGLASGRRVLAGALELGGYSPSPDSDDFEAIADAARLDAIACAYAVHRGITQPRGSVVFGASGHGEMLIPVDANLRGRLEINLDRMRGQGEVSPSLQICDGFCG